MGFCISLASGGFLKGQGEGNEGEMEREKGSYEGEVNNDLYAGKEEEEGKGWEKVEMEEKWRRYEFKRCKSEKNGRGRSREGSRKETGSERRKGARRKERREWEGKAMEEEVCIKRGAGRERKEREFRVQGRGGRGEEQGGCSNE